MPKFFVNKNQINEDNIIIDGEDVKHMQQVLRLKKDDKITICDGQGNDYECIIYDINKKSITTKIIQTIKSQTEPNTKVILYQALPKSEKMEYIIQKSVELGVFEIVPIMTKNIVVKLDELEKQKKKIERWNKIAEAAAKQSGRGIIPVVKDCMAFSEAVNKSKDLDQAIVLYEKENTVRLCDVLKNEQNEQNQTIGIFIGPEGGFCEKEIEYAKENEVQTVTLGKRILRTETVSSMILSIIMYEKGEI